MASRGCKFATPGPPRAGGVECGVHADAFRSFALRLPRRDLRRLRGHPGHVAADAAARRGSGQRLARRRKGDRRCGRPIGRRQGPRRRPSPRRDPRVLRRAAGDEGGGARRRGWLHRRASRARGRELGHRLRAELEVHPREVRRKAVDRAPDEAGDEERGPGRPRVRRSAPAGSEGPRRRVRRPFFTTTRSGSRSTARR